MNRDADSVMLRIDSDPPEDTISMAKQNAFYAQSGGVTAVINATACGVIETARKHRDRIANVYAGRNGIIGALTEDMIDTNRESAKTIAALRHTPGGAFGPCSIGAGSQLLLAQPRLHVSASWWNSHGSSAFSRRIM